MGEINLTIGQAARQLDCSIESLKRMEEQGLVKYRRMMGNRVLNATEIEALRQLREGYVRPPLKRRTQGAS
jgi:hypothetical protein